MGLKFLFFLLFLGVAPCVLTLECNDVTSKSTVLRLKKFLFCDYDFEIRPGNHSNATFVHFALIPRFAEVNEYSGTFDLHTWTILTWSDSHIEWVPAQYDGIKELHLGYYDIWVPDITAHNAGDGDDFEIPMSGCWVSHVGDVTCVSPVRLTGRCKTDHKWWPYETYNCTIELASWSHSRDEISFGLINDGLLMNEYEENKAWAFEKAYVTENIQPFKMDDKSVSHFLAIHFVLRRSTSFEHAVFISPTIVLIVLTLTALWLEPKSIERSVVANLNFICHLLCIMDIYWLLPYNEFGVPNIIIFYNGSLTLATFVLILTTCLRHLQELTSEAPMWVSNGTSRILSSKLGQILLLSILDPKASAGLEIEADDNIDLVRSDKKDMAWEYVAILIGWVAFLGTVLAYIVMLGLLFPRESSGL